MENKSNKLHTQYLLLKDFIYELDKALRLVIQKSAINFIDFQHIVFLQKHSPVNPQGLNINSEFLPVLESFNYGKLDISITTSSANICMLHDYWNNLRQINYEVYFDTERRGRFIFTLKIDFNNDGYSVSYLNKNYSYGVCPSNKDIELLIDVFANKLSLLKM